MIDQGFQPVAAWNYALSLHYVFPPISAVVQICLSSRHDFAEDPPLPAAAVALFTEYTADGRVVELLSRPGLTSTFRANALTEVKGLLIGNRCRVDAFVNFFVWP